MSAADIESLIPFLQQLLQRMRLTPPAGEMELLKKATFKEMRPYFDALAAGTSEQEVYKMILAYLAGGGKPAAASSPAVARSRVSPQRATSPQRPPATVTDTAQGPNSGGKQIRKVMEDVELHILEQRQGGPNKLPWYLFELATKGTPNPTTLTIDFSDSVGMELQVDGPSRSTAPMKLSVNVPTIANTGGKLLCATIAKVLALSAGHHSLNYKIAVRGDGAAATTAQQPPAKAADAMPPSQQHAPPAAVAASEEGDDVTTVADGLSIIVRSVDAGYLLLASNTHATLKYAVQVNLSESTNLTFVATGAAKLLEDAKVSISLPPATGTLEIAKCNVKDFSLGSCDIRYKVSARVE